MIKYPIETIKGQTRITLTPIPSIIESEGINYLSKDILAKEQEIIEIMERSPQEGSNTLSKNQQDEKSLIDEIRANIIPYLKAEIIIDNTIETIAVKGRSEAIKQLEKQNNIEYPYHFIWLDGVEKEQGVIIFPKSTYSKVYVVKGTQENPEIIFIKENKGDIELQRPYYEIKDNKTYVYMDGFSGAGTSEDPWQVTSYTDLKKVGCGDTTGDYNGWDMDSYYIQTANIQCPTGGSQENHEPLGIDADPFTGQYDGDNYYIKDLYIYRPTTIRQGLFGRSASTTVLKNIVLIDPYVESSGYCGALLGTSTASTITNCHVRGGTIKTESASGRTGGLVGDVGASSVITYCSSSADIAGHTIRAGSLFGQVVGGTVQHCYSTGDVTLTSTEYDSGACIGLVSAATIEDCFSTGSISSSGTNIAGFAGKIQSGSVVKRCYATGNASGNNSVAGFVGDYRDTNSLIENCYAKGNLTGVTGIISGFCAWKNDTNCEIKKSYSTGTPSGTGSGYNLIGFNQRNGTGISDCYWDTTTSGTTISDGGTGKTTSQMKTESTFTNWDFTDTWVMDSNLNSGYPHLQDLLPQYLDSNVYQTKRIVKDISEFIGQTKRTIKTAVGGSYQTLRAAIEATAASYQTKRSVLISFLLDYQTNRIVKSLSSFVSQTLRTAVSLSSFGSQTIRNITKLDTINYQTKRIVHAAASIVAQTKRSILYNAHNTYQTLRKTVSTITSSFQTLRKPIQYCINTFQTTREVTIKILTAIVENMAIRLNWIWRSGGEE